jgi:nitrite reductase/ring-hydroxylating ferredoxin subunit
VSSRAAEPFRAQAVGAAARAAPAYPVMLPMRFYALEKFINLHDGYRRVFKIDQHRLLLVQERGECYLLEAFCPHRGYALDDAEIVDGQLRCPLHGYRYALDSGALRFASEEPCRNLRRYELIQRDTDVGVLL